MGTDKYRGTWTALMTPFKPNGDVDEVALRGLVRRQIEAGVTGVAPVGTTGESPTTTAEEDRRIFEVVVEAANGQIAVMAGTGSNVTKHAVEYTQAAKESGADCCLVVSPYYNKPTPAGLKLHYDAVADVGLPVVVYNIQSRTGSNIDTDTLMRIAEHKMVVGVKEASGSSQQVKEVLDSRDSDFAVLSGDDANALELVEMGGDGVISVAANVVPAQVVELMNLALAGDFAQAKQLETKLSDLFSKLFIETNPIPVKYACHKLNLCELVYRLPMCPPSAETRKILDRMLASYGLS